jgi:hypothetical protein
MSSPVLSVPYEFSGSAPLRFPHKITRLFLSGGVFIRCDLTAVIKLVRDGFGALLWVIEGESSRASHEVHARDLKAPD